jgi:RNA polymerase sigma factor (sigma-70 family)
MNRTQFLEGLETVYAEAWAAVPAWCRRHGLNEQLARDALQDLVVEICEHWTRPPDVRLLKHYMRCRVINAMRKQRRTVNRAATEVPTPVEFASRSERVRRLEAAVGSCSERERQLVAFVGDNRSLRSAARHLGTSRHEVDTLWRRLSDRFRTVVDGE